MSNEEEIHSIKPTTPYVPIGYTLINHRDYGYKHVEQRLKSKPQLIILDGNRGQMSWQTKGTLSRFRPRGHSTKKRRHSAKVHLPI